MLLMRYLILLLLSCSSAMAGTATGTMMVTATVLPKAVPTIITLPNNTAIIKDLPMGTKVSTVTNGNTTTITVSYE